jgi:hypothetical protein
MKTSLAVPELEQVKVASGSGNCKSNTINRIEEFAHRLAELIIEHAPLTIRAAKEALLRIQAQLQSISFSDVIRTVGVLIECLTRMERW